MVFPGQKQYGSDYNDYEILSSQGKYNGKFLILMGNNKHSFLPRPIRNSFVQIWFEISIKAEKPGQGRVSLLL